MMDNPGFDPDAEAKKAVVPNGSIKKKVGLKTEGDGTAPGLNPDVNAKKNAIPNGSIQNKNIRKTGDGEIQSKADDITQGRKKMNNDPELSESLLDIQPNGSAKVIVERPVISQRLFDEQYESGIRPPNSIKKSLNKAYSKCRCSGKCCTGFLFGIFPFISILKHYSIKEDLPNDIISGLTVGIMHIPQGMAYGMLTTLDPIYGLYTSFFPVFVYFFFGTSRHISIGTFAVASLMIGSAIEKGMTNAGLDLHPPDQSTMNNSYISTTSASLLNTTSLFNDTTTGTTSSAINDEIKKKIDATKLEYAMAVTLMIGIVQGLMGITRLGFVTTYLSDPLISGFTTGAACHVFTSQIKHIFGIQTGRYSGAWKLIFTYRDFFINIPMTNSITLIASVVCMVILYVVKEFINNNPKLKPRMKMPVPIELIVVVLGTVISSLVQLEQTYNVSTVGNIPTGLPAPSPPNFSLLPDVISDAFAIAIVVFAVSVSMGKILAKKHEYEIDSNQELIAYSMCNIFSCFFSSYCSSASLSRSLVQEHVGGRTQVAGIVSCCLLLLVLLLLGPYFSALPKCVLAAIIIVALKGMFRQFLELPKLWKLSKIDFFVWVSTFLATFLLDVDLGLLVGVIIAILTIVFRVQRPYVCLLGNMPGTDIYRDTTVYKEAVEIPGIKIFRFENALFFVSVEHFRSKLYKYTTNARHLKLEIKKAKQKKYKEEQKNKNKMEFHKQAQNSDGDQVMQLSEEDIVQAPQTFTSSIQIPKTDFHTVILDCSTWSFIDSMGVKALSSIVSEFKEIDVNIYLALCKAGVREMFEKTGFFDICERDNLFVSIHDAVLHAQHIQQQDSNLGNGLNHTGLSTMEIEIEIPAGSDETDDADMDTGTDNTPHENSHL